MRYARWEDAYISQQQILEWSQSEIGVKYLIGFFGEMNEKHTEKARRDVRVLAGIQLEMLREAEPIYVSSDVTDLIDDARAKWKPEKLLPNDPFAPRGFCLFPRPVLIDDMPVTKTHPWRSGIGLIPVRAVAWLPIHSEDLSVGTYWIAFYVHCDDEFALADERGVPSRLEMGHPDDPEPVHSRDEIRRIMPFSIVHQWQWSWGQPGYESLDDPEAYDILAEDSFEDVRERARQQTSLIQTMWRIGSQLVPTKARLPRQLRRDSQRKKRPVDDVTVITLRRGRQGQEEMETTGRRLTVRFVVRGHWRNQWYASLGEHRQIWIAPYVKGPDDVPLRLTKRAWQFTR
jgi:hypothetical protein